MVPLVLPLAYAAVANVAPMATEYAAWTPVKIPGELMARVDEFLASDANKWGYRSKQDVVTNAVREFLKEAFDAAG